MMIPDPLFFHVLKDRPKEEQDDNYALLECVSI